MKSRSATSIWRKALLAFVSFTLTVVALEVVFRVAGIKADYYEPHTHEFVFKDDGPRLVSRMGAVPLAIHRTYYHTDPRNYFGPATEVDHPLNSAGWRDVEHTIVKPPGTYRILGLGDSYLMGQGVHSEDVFFRQLEQLLKQADLPSQVETISTGVSGKNTVDQAQLLEERGLAYDPDLVVVNFVPNDVEQDLTSEEPIVEFYREYTKLTQKPDFLSHYSYLWSWVRQRVQKQFVAQKYIKESIASFDRDSKKWSVCRNALLKIIQICRERDIPVMVVIFPFFHELNGDYPFQPIHDRVNELCRENGVPVLDLRDSYREFSGPELWVHPTDQHPNEIAHKLAAEAMAEFIVEHRGELQFGRRPPPQHGPSEETRLQALAKIAQLYGGLSSNSEYLTFENVPLADGDLRLLEPYWQEIEDLSWISLRNTKVGNDTVQILCQKDNWVGIDLSFTQVTSSGVTCLSEQEQLDQLGLQGTNIDDSAIEAFANHPSLSALNLADTPISEQAIDSLETMPRLETLVVNGTAIGVEGVRRLAKFPHLKTLSIAENMIDENLRQEIAKDYPTLNLVVQSQVQKPQRP